MHWLLSIGIALTLSSLLLWWISRQLRRRTGIPTGRVIYSDTRGWQECPKPLYAASVNLTGKPDYLVQKWNYVLPVEIKSSMTTTVRPPRSESASRPSIRFFRPWALGLSRM